MLNKETELLEDRNLAEDVNCGNPAIQADANQFITDVANALDNQAAVLPINPGFEKHPYKGVLENTQASKYIIGTFPPVSYLIDTLRNNGININHLNQPTHPHQPIIEPNIPFFHGNVSGLWSVLLPPDDLDELNDLLENDRLATKTFLINWLTDNGIYYDDIISYTQRKLVNLNPHDNLGYTAEDVNLKNICPDISLVQLVLNNIDLKVVCFTNGATFRSGNNGGLRVYDQINRLGFVRTTNADALSLFLRTCQDVGLKIEMQCQPHFNWTPLHQLTAVQKRTKLIFELRITKTQTCTLEALRSFTQKTFTAITPFSPAAHGNIEHHPIIASYRNINGYHSCDDILKWVYEKLRTDSYAQLYQYNINQ